MVSNGADSHRSIEMLMDCDGPREIQISSGQEHCSIYKNHRNSRMDDKEAEGYCPIKCHNLLPSFII